MTQPLVSMQEVDPSCTKHLSDIWGPTCAPDKICSSLLPELDVGDWIYFKDWGGYTTCLTTKFCGFPSPSAYYYIDDSHRCVFFSKLKQFSETVHIVADMYWIWFFKHV